MKVRAYYWTRPRPGLGGRIYYRMRRRRISVGFWVGNAGDIFALNLIDHVYGIECRRVVGEGHRLLTVGSILDHAVDGDVLSGIGARFPEAPGPNDLQVVVTGVRGPRTVKILQEAGHDVSRLESLGDPGLLISRMLSPRQPKTGQVLLLPHFNDRPHFRSVRPRWMKFLDIDADPLDVGNAILDSEAVVTSSLHGVVFAHALGRPCLLVQPSSEADMKYRDHYEAVGVPWREPASDITRVRPRDLPSEPSELKRSASDLKFPSIGDLTEFGVIEDG